MKRRLTYSSDSSPKSVREQKLPQQSSNRSTYSFMTYNEAFVDINIEVIWDVEISNDVLLATFTFFLYFFLSFSTARKKKNKQFLMLEATNI